MRSRPQPSPFPSPNTPAIRPKMPSMPSIITLKLVDESNWRQALTLSVLPSQQHFVADHLPVVAIALAKAYIRPDGLTWQPYAIYADQQMVGFVEVALERHQPDDCWLFHFFIDHNHQGRGYGRAAMQALIRLIKQTQPTCTAMCLVVHPENAAAQLLYHRIGFEATGEYRWGEPIYRLSFRDDAQYVGTDV